MSFERRFFDDYLTMRQIIQQMMIAGRFNDDSMHFHP